MVAESSNLKHIKEEENFFLGGISFYFQSLTTFILSSSFSMIEPKRRDENNGLITKEIYNQIYFHLQFKISKTE